MTKKTDREVAAETGDTEKNATNAAHTARDDAEKEGYFKRGDDDLNSKKFSDIDPDRSKEVKDMQDKIIEDGKK